MIVTKIIGGLGNQLFQYALGRHLALKNDTQLYLDLRAFDDYYSLHKYALNHFNINATPASDKELKQFIALTNPWERIRRKFSNLLSPWQFIDENTEKHHADILSLTGNIYLDGYWQSEDYFIDVRPMILKELSLRNTLSPNSIDIYQQIEVQTCASIHIRRGDYLSNQKTNSVHGLCDLNYYKKAMDKLENIVEIESYYVFSDDILWAKENLKSRKELIFVDHNDASSNFEDLVLMSKCSHHIIANSSFSWWGAWLNENEQKITVAPKKWFADESKDSSRIIPKNWIKC
ncbi:alpha-1,2-fucosyltransferase [Reichenbachiella sp.]|uniref:alpha-1,2-fucosyltransferase n=1 Tax=Reichenbachiella sp. TaxID=2184521 RepID=UPI003B5A5606